MVRADLRASADRVCDHEFDILGSGLTKLGERIDWHTDFKTGYRWSSRQYFAGIQPGRITGADIKVPWELSRGHQLLVLAQAWRVTGDSKYSREAARQFDDWLASNPPSFGVNWTSAMEVGIRAVNWLWASGLLADSEDVTDDLFERILASLVAHGRHIRTNLEIHSDGRTTNHYLANLVGLLYLGLCLPPLSESQSWRRFALAGLEAEMEKQVLADGADFESSIPYHGLVSEMFLSAAWLADRCGIAMSAAFLTRLAQMVEFTIAYTKPNNLAPQIGDGDDGRLHVLSGYGSVDARDHRHLIAVGGRVFGRSEWLRLSGDRWIETLWLGGPDILPTGPVQPQASAAFRNAGIYVLRGHGDMVVVAATPVGTGGLGNHKHNDLLAVEIHLQGEDILVDAGTYLYTPDPTARDAFRSTAAHNTVMIDEVEQNRIPPGSLFSLHEDAQPRLVSWEPTSEGGAVCVEHDGYMRLDRPVRHRRTVRLVQPHRVSVEDFFAGEAGSSHHLAWTFAFAPGCQLSPADSGWIITTARQRRFLLTRPCTLEGIPIAVTTASATGFVSPSYGVRKTAPVLRWTWEGGLPLTVTFHTEAIH